MPDPNTTNDSESIGISDGAAKQIADLIEKEDKVGMRLRVAVSGGGCSGFQYGFTFEEVINEVQYEAIFAAFNPKDVPGAEIPYIQRKLR